MSEDRVERLKKLVEKCVNSAEVDEALMKSVRSLCRKEESSISTVVVEILWFLKRKHCVVRWVEHRAFNLLWLVLIFSGYVACNSQNPCFKGLMPSEFFCSRYILT